jgi:hypothetical protein
LSCYKGETDFLFFFHLIYGAGKKKDCVSENHKDNYYFFSGFIGEFSRSVPHELGICLLNQLFLLAGLNCGTLRG